MKLSYSRNVDDPPLVAATAVTRWLDDLRHPVAVTGGTGFVGSHLVDTLCDARVRPRVLVRDPESPRWISGLPVEAVQGCLGDRESLARLVSGAGTVIHLAGVLRAARADDFDRGNRQGTANLVHALRKVAPAARLVHVSSLAAAGPSQTVEGVGPEDCAKPISDYGRSKLAAEEAVRSFAGDAGWVMLRPPAIYGPRDTDVLEFFRMAARGLCVVPSGERWLTISHVADVVRAILAAAASTAPRRRIFHLGEVRAFRLTELLDELATAGGVRARTIRVPPLLVSVAGAGGSLLRRLGFTGTALTRDKAREILALHWTSRTADSLEALGVGDGLRFGDGARDTWSWYRHMNWLP